MTKEHTQECTVWAPLTAFKWEGDRFDAGPAFQIVRPRNVPDLSEGRKRLSDLERRAVDDASHWLTFTMAREEVLKPSEKINLFQLALWVAVRTRTQVVVSFRRQQDVGPPRVVSHYDRFQPLEVDPQQSIDTNRLQEARRYLQSIEDIYPARKRLRNALVLTFAACTSVHWQVRVICFSAAAEAILTYSEKRGVTKRLCRSFACLTEKLKPARDSAYLGFKRLYHVRSEIMHGRAMDRTDVDQNLTDTGRFSDMLRQLWRRVLSSPEAMRELEENDEARHAFFARIQQGYVPPKKPARGDK